MPEGDTIYRTALQLRAMLVQQAVRATSDVADVRPISGSSVDSVKAKGKHLLIHFDSGFTIHTHLGMTGSWHTYQPDERWRKPRSQSAIALQTTSGNVAVCFHPKTFELLSEDGLRRHPWLNRLGPDLLDSGVDFELIVSNFRRQPDLHLGVAVMDQRLLMGIGNVYKSELLFLEKLNPFLTIQCYSDEQLLQMLRRGQRLMRANLDGGPRRTRMGRDGSRTWVYGRGGKPCLKCSDLIQMQRQGDLGRSTYWCLNCQENASNT